MKTILIKLLSVALTLYFTSIIVFFQHYINITYFIDAFLIIIFFTVVIVNKDLKYSINEIIYLFGLFVVIGLASSFWAIDFHEASYKSLQLFLILINLFVIYNSFKKFRLEDTFIYGVLLASFVNYLIMLGFLEVPFNIILPGGGNRAIGTTGNPNVLSIVMMISILSSIIYINKNKEKYSKIFYYYQFLNIALALYMIVLTVSKKGIIFGTLLMFLYFMLIIKRIKGIITIGLILFITFMYFYYFIEFDDIIFHYNNIMVRFDALNTSLSGGTGWDSTTIRKNLILSGIDAIENRPLLGYGMANFHFVSFNGQYAHNNYIETLANVGIIGAIVFYLIYISLIKKIFMMKKCDLKYMLFYFVLIFLFMDFAVVTYGSKFTIYTLLYLAFIAELHKKTIKNKIF